MLSARLSLMSTFCQADLARPWARAVDISLPPLPFPDQILVFREFHEGGLCLFGALPCTI